MTPRRDRLGGVSPVVSRSAADREADADDRAPGPRRPRRRRSGLPAPLGPLLGHERGGGSLGAGALSGLLGHPGSFSVRRNSRLSTAYGVVRAPDQPQREQQQARRRGRSPTGTRRWRSADVPPPPKQPHSICRPRAQADAMPTMNATNSSDDSTAAARVSRPRTRQRPTTTSSTGSRWPTVGTIASGSRS